MEPSAELLSTIKRNVSNMSSNEGDLSLFGSGGFMPGYGNGLVGGLCGDGLVGGASVLSPHIAQLITNRENLKAAKRSFIGTGPSAQKTAINAALKAADRELKSVLGLKAAPKRRVAKKKVVKRRVVKRKVVKRKVAKKKVGRKRKVGRPKARK